MAIIICIMFLVAGVSVYDYFDSKDWQSATSASRNSLIFEHRNKKYGAYHLRRDYNDSFGIIIALVILCLAIFFIINRNLTSAYVEAPITYKIDTTLLTIAAPPVEEIKTVKTPYKIVGGGGGGSAGAASVNPIDRNPKDQAKTEQTIDKSSVSVNSGKSDNTNSDKPNQNPATTLIKGANPFGGGGAKTGPGSGIFGKDNGPGSGEGDGNGINGVGGGTGGGKRKKLTRLNVEGIESNIDCIIYVKVYINAEGAVIRAENLGKKTNTTNSSLIAEVIEEIKRQIKYDKRPAGTAIQTDEFAVQIQAR